MSQRQSRIDWVQSVLGVPIQVPPQESRTSEGGDETPLQALRRRVKEAIQSVGALLLGEAFDETILEAKAARETLTDINQKLGLIDQALVHNDAPVEQWATELREQVTRIKTVTSQVFNAIAVDPARDYVGDKQPEYDENIYWTKDEFVACDLVDAIEHCLTETGTHPEILQAMPEIRKKVTPTSGDIVQRVLEVFRESSDVVEKALKQLESYCVEIDQDTVSYMDKALQALREQVSFFDAVNPINPVAYAAALLDQRASGVGTGLEAAKQRLWIAEAAKPETKDANVARRIKTRLDKIVGQYEAQMETLSGVPSAVEALAKFKDDILLTCVREKTIGDLESTWRDLAEKGAKTLKGIFQKATTEAVKPEQLIEGLNTMSKAFDKLVKTLTPEALGKIVGGWGLGSELSTDPGNLKPEMLTKVINETIAGAGQDKEKLNEVNTDLQKALTASFDQILTDKPPEALDAFIDGIGDKVALPVTQLCCVAALKKRFGMNITIPEGVQVTRLPELYTLMKRLPAAHVSPQNKKMQTIEYETSSGPSSYGAGKIALNQMATKVAPYLDLEQPEKQVELDYFSAVTLHEIGHSVDDANTIMPGKKDDPEFGDWNHPEDQDIADVIYSEYLSKVTIPVDVSLVKELAKSAVKYGHFVEPQNARNNLFPLAPYWEEFRKTGVFDAIRNAANVEGRSWRQPFLKDDKRAYHQRDHGKWVSYSLAERNSKAISVYQYRAPGEWFAEIYARYHVVDPSEKGDADRQRVKSRVGDKVIAFVTGSDTSN